MPTPGTTWISLTTTLVCRYQEQSYLCNSSYLLNITSWKMVYLWYMAWNDNVKVMREHVTATDMRTEATVVERIKPCCYQRNESRAQKPAALDSCLAFWRLSSILIFWMATGLCTFLLSFWIAGFFGLGQRFPIYDASSIVEVAALLRHCSKAAECCVWGI